MKTDGNNQWGLVHSGCNKPHSLINNRNVFLTPPKAVCVVYNPVVDTDSPATDEKLLPGSQMALAYLCPHLVVGVRDFFKDSFIRALTLSRRALLPWLNHLLVSEYWRLGSKCEFWSKQESRFWQNGKNIYIHYSSHTHLRVLAGMRLILIIWTSSGIRVCLPSIQLKMHLILHGPVLCSRWLILTLSIAIWTHEVESLLHLENYLI